MPGDQSRKQSSVYFHTVVTANRAGKEALQQLLDKLPVSQADYERSREVTQGAVYVGANEESQGGAM